MNTDTAVVDFREARGGNIWAIEVIVDGIVSGHIYDGNGTYRYFEGPYNDITWSFAEFDLERLKARIRATVLAEHSAADPRSAAWSD
jgi:hypothetical protein